MKKEFFFAALFGLGFYLVFKYIVEMIFKIPFDHFWFVLGIVIIVVLGVLFSWGFHFWHKAQSE